MVVLVRIFDGCMKKGSKIRLMSSGAAYHIDRTEQPWIKATVMCPGEFLGSTLKPCEQERGVQVNLTFAGDRTEVEAGAVGGRHRLLQSAEGPDAAPDIHDPDLGRQSLRICDAWILSLVSGYLLSAS
ncbi:MAG: hypothetical protein P1U37_12695 [Minwuia sp.]|nr:hypothetical protein [Minwuia sp.]